MKLIEDFEKAVRRHEMKGELFLWERKEVELEYQQAKSKLEKALKRKRKASEKSSAKSNNKRCLCNYYTPGANRDFD